MLVPWPQPRISITPRHGPAVLLGEARFTKHGGRCSCPRAGHDFQDIYNALDRAPTGIHIPGMHHIPGAQPLIPKPLSIGHGAVIATVA